MAAITSAFPEWYGHRVALGLGFMALIAIGNLRGVRESGPIFAVPTYFFLITLLGLLVVGAARVLDGDDARGPRARDRARLGGAMLTTFLVLRAFANGCTAMTGVEAISNGVPAFKPPGSEERGRHA